MVELCKFALDEAERMDTDGTDRARVTYEYLRDLMRINDDVRATPIHTLARLLEKRIG